MKYSIDNFYENGIAIIENESHENWIFFSALLEDFLGHNLSNLHIRKKIEDINSIRIQAVDKINKIDGWEDKYVLMAGKALNKLLGSDIAIQRKLNLNIQLPKDNTSQLEMHMDTFAGESPFEIILWVPFTKAYGSNGMYFFDKNLSKKISKEIVENEQKGIGFLRKKYFHLRQELDVDTNSIVIFSSTILHGNILNSTSESRVSINCRLKNIFHPESSRDLGFFYKIKNLGSLARIGIEYSENEYKFN